MDAVDTCPMALPDGDALADAHKAVAKQTWLDDKQASPMQEKAERFSIVLASLHVTCMHTRST